MGKINVNDLLDAGVHFGHLTRRRNPKMKPYLYGTMHRVSVFDLTITIRYLAQACQFLENIAANNGKILFVGTKPQARDMVRRGAEETDMFYVVHRWLGGMLTNNNVIMSRVRHLNELRRMNADGEIDEYPNKEAAKMRRELAKLERTLGGLSDMRQLPDAVVVADVNRDDIAVHEARKCGIPVVALVDSDCTPDEVDYIIPGNDDAYRSVETIVNTLVEAVKNGLSRLGKDFSQTETGSEEAEEPQESAETEENTSEQSQKEASTPVASEKAASESENTDSSSA